MINKSISYHPGEVLSLVYLKEHRLSPSQLAELCGYSYQSIEEVLDGRRKISSDLAKALEEVFKVSAEFWLEMQRDFDQRECG